MTILEKKEKTKALISRLVEKHKYKPLPPGESEYVRKQFKDALPPFLKDKIDGSDIKLYTSRVCQLCGTGSLVCNGFKRIVIGDYGAYVEFSEEEAAETFCTIRGQEWRSEEKYKNSKYEALTPYSFKHLRLENGAPLIYKQKHTVGYADYKVGKYYISVYDVYPAIIPNGYVENDRVKIVCTDFRRCYDSYWEVTDKATSSICTITRDDCQKADELLEIINTMLMSGDTDFDIRSLSRKIYYD